MKEVKNEIEICYKPYKTKILEPTERHYIQKKGGEYISN